MKGMAIFLVVIGHVYGMVFNQGEDITYKWISSFHMPLFMFASGFIYMATKKDITYRDFLLKKVKRLMIRSSASAASPYQADRSSA